MLTLDGDLYAGTSVDFMGTTAAIFRTPVHSSNQHYIRTEAYQDQWLNGEKWNKNFIVFIANVCKDNMALVSKVG